MRVLVENVWKDNYLDYWNGPDEIIVEVIANLSIEKIDGLYFERKRSIRIILNYIFEIGVINVFRKIISRSQERIRNQKYVSIGLGKLLNKSSNISFNDNVYVAFISTSHPLCVDRIVLPVKFLQEIDEKILPSGYKNNIYTSVINAKNELHEIVKLKGWNNNSGQCIPENLSNCLSQSIEYLKNFNWAEAKRWPKIYSSYNTNSLSNKNNNPTTKKNAVLFGYGNYAKTIIIPNIKNNISIEMIHEIDPLQIPRNRNNNVTWSTSPFPIGAKNIDVYLIAGYHHTHAKLAIKALNDNAYAVVEKPIVVDEDQLSMLVKTMKNNGKGIFSCFHKRYLPFNTIAIQDLDITVGKDPISYHCIVHEVPLPNLHWYKWPNSKSRLVSNGCHWIDHFLNLNGFCKPVDCQLVVAKDGTINCSVELENKAFFSMLLTDVGSSRIGVQDYIELRSNHVTVSIKNGSEYISENANKIIRTTKINKMDSYREMYKSISQAIANDESGDSISSLEISSRLILDLESKYRELCNHQ